MTTPLHGAGVATPCSLLPGPRWARQLRRPRLRVRARLCLSPSLVRQAAATSRSCPALPARPRTPRRIRRPSRGRAALAAHLLLLPHRTRLRGTSGSTRPQMRRESAVRAHKRNSCTQSPRQCPAACARRRRTLARRRRLPRGSSPAPLLLCRKGALALARAVLDPFASGRAAWPGSTTSQTEKRRRRHTPCPASFWGAAASLDLPRWRLMCGSSCTTFLVAPRARLRSPPCCCCRPAPRL